jgi:hypothetical protein
MARSTGITTRHSRRCRFAQRRRLQLRAELRGLDLEPA